jgi:tetratricopeptide (TPR) repeat protein
MNIKRLILLLLQLPLLLPLPCLAAQDSLNIAVISADQAYREGKFNQAIQLYQGVIDKGFESAGLYYNLGNSCFKTGDMARAILYYEKSLKLRPGDENAAFNLKVAQAKTIDKIEEVPQPFYKRAWRTARSFFRVDTWAWIILIFLSLTLLCLASFLLARKIFMRKFSFWMGILFVLLTVLSNLLAYSQYSSKSEDKAAIVFDPALHVKSSPDESSSDVFVIHEGTRISIRDQIGDWYEISIANGSVGWIRASAVRLI